MPNYRTKDSDHNACCRALACADARRDRAALDFLLNDACPELVSGCPGQKWKLKPLGVTEKKIRQKVEKQFKESKTANEITPSCFLQSKINTFNNISPTKSVKT